MTPLTSDPECNHLASIILESHYPTDITELSS